MRARTVDEMLAYLDGFNACFDWFEKYLSEEETIEDALKKMEKLKQAVNSVVRKEKNERTT